MTTSAWTPDDIANHASETAPPIRKVGRPSSNVKRFHIQVDTLFRSMVEELMVMCNFSAMSETISQAIGYHHDIETHIAAGGTCTFIMPDKRREGILPKRHNLGLGAPMKTHITMNPVTINRLNAIATMTNTEGLTVGPRVSMTIHEFYHFMTRIRAGGHLVLEFKDGTSRIYMPWRTSVSGSEAHQTS